MIIVVVRCTLPGTSRAADGVGYAQSRTFGAPSGEGVRRREHEIEKVYPDLAHARARADSQPAASVPLHHRGVRLEVGDGLRDLLRAGLLKLAAGAERVELGVAVGHGPAVEGLALARGDGAHAVRVRALLLVADRVPVVLVVDDVNFPVDVSPDDVDPVLDLPQRARLPKERLEDLVEDGARSRGGGGLLAAVARSETVESDIMRRREVDQDRREEKRGAAGARHRCDTRHIGGILGKPRQRRYLY